MKDNMFGIIFKSSLLSLAIAYPLTLLSAIFVILTYGTSYDNMLILLLLISLIFILTTIISIKIKFMTYKKTFNTLLNASYRKDITFLIIDIIIALLLLIFRQQAPIAAAICIALWLIIAYIITFRKIKTNKVDVGFDFSNIYSQDRVTSQKRKTNDNVIDIDEQGNIDDK